MATLAGRHALVTGGGRGIGRAIAAALTQAGATVTVAGRGEKTLADTVGQGDAAGFVVADVTDIKAVDNGIKQAVAARGPVDLLIANAGTAVAVLAGMIERGFGRIVAIASIVGLRASPNVAPYTTAKHAMVGLVRSVAVETAGSGVTVNAVCPGYVDTELIRGPLERLVERGANKEEALARFTSRVPVGRLVRPEEVAQAVLYFCSPAAAATTGATLVIGADGA
jgi:NAD(P)-dependent dehydrogenase (short-subunit alcohol dehydrogenase family)